MPALPVLPLILCQAGSPFPPPLPPRWELEAPPEYRRSTDFSHSVPERFIPPDSLSAVFPPAESLGPHCSLGPVPHGSTDQSNPAFYRPFDWRCINLRSMMRVPVADCGLAFYQSPSGDRSAIFAFALPTADAAEAAHARSRASVEGLKAFVTGTVVAFVVSEGSGCSDTLESAFLATKKH